MNKVSKVALIAGVVILAASHFYFQYKYGECIELKLLSPNACIAKYL